MLMIHMQYLLIDVFLIPVSFINSQYVISQATPKQIAESIELLLNLKEPADTLCDEFLEQWVLIFLSCIEDLFDEWV